MLNSHTTATDLEHRYNNIRTSHASAECSSACNIDYFAASYTR